MSASSGTEVVRIFVGCDPNDCDLEQMMVLDHSLHEHASLPLEIHWMRLSTDRGSPWFSDPANAAGWRTDRLARTPEPRDEKAVRMIVPRRQQSSPRHPHARQQWPAAH